MRSSKSSLSKTSRKNLDRSATKRKKNGETERIQYVLPLGGNGWVVKNSLATSFTLISDTKREAISVARTIAKSKNAQLMVYGRNGALEISENYFVKSKTPKKKTA